MNRNRDRGYRAGWVAGLSLLALSSPAAGQTCPSGVEWTLGSIPGERVYTCRGDLSTSAGHEGYDDGVAIQDAIQHAAFACETASPLRTVTIAPAPNGQPCAIKAKGNGAIYLVRPDNDDPGLPPIGRLWVRGLVGAGTGGPPVLKLDAQSSTLSCDPFISGAGNGAVARMFTTTLSPVSGITFSDLALDGSNDEIRSRFSPDACNAHCAGGEPCMNFEQGHGIIMSFVSDASVDKLSIKNVLGDGVYYHSASTNVRATNLTISHSNRVAINVDGVNYGLVSNNAISDVATEAIKTEDSVGTIGHMLWLDNVASSSVVAGSGDPATRVTDIVIAHNSLFPSPGNLIALVGLGHVEGVIVAENTLVGGVNGVTMIRGVRNVLVRANKVSDIADSPIAQIFNVPTAFAIGGNAAIDFPPNGGLLFAENDVRNVPMGAYVTFSRGTTRGISLVGNTFRGLASGPPLGPNPLHGMYVVDATDLLFAQNQVLGFHVGVRLSWRGPLVGCAECDIAVPRNVSLIDNLLRGAPSGTTQSYGIAVDGDDGTNAGELTPHALLVTGNDLRPDPGDPCFAPLVGLQSSPQPTDIIPARQGAEVNAFELAANAGVTGFSRSGAPLQSCGLVPAPARIGTHVRRAAVGTVTVGTNQRTATVTLPAPEPDAQYAVGVSASGWTGGTPSSGATRIRSVSKQANQFTLTLDANTQNSSVTFNWMVRR